VAVTSSPSSDDSISHFPCLFLPHSLWMCIRNFANNCTHGRLLSYMQSAVKKKLNSQPHFVSWQIIVERRMRSFTNLSSQVFQLVDFSATKLYTPTAATLQIIIAYRLYPHCMTLFFFFFFFFQTLFCFLSIGYILLEGLL
jgi:hypothetical protein